MQSGQRVAVGGMMVSGALALIKIVLGLSGHSTAVTGNRHERISARASTRLALIPAVCQVQPRLHDRIGIEREAVNALIDEPAREIRVV